MGPPLDDLHPALIVQLLVGAELVEGEVVA
jgi:hypothetical protein